MYARQNIRRLVELHSFGDSKEIHVMPIVIRPPLNSARKTIPMARTIWRPGGGVPAFLSSRAITARCAVGRNMVFLPVVLVYT